MMNLQILFDRITIPQPCLSRGAPLGNIKIQVITFNCWQVLPDSPVYKAYLQIASHLSECLRHPDLQGGCAVHYTPCLIGLHEDRIRPAVVIHCSDRRYRDFAINLIRKTEEWKTFVHSNSGFVLVKSSHAPILLAMGDGIAIQYVFRLEGRYVGLGSSLSFAPDSTFRIKTTRKATSGITLRIGEQPYLLTVSHPLQSITQNQRPAGASFTGADNNEIVFFDDDDDDDADSDGSPSNSYSQFDDTSNSVQSTSSRADVPSDATLQQLQAVEIEQASLSSHLVEGYRIGSIAHLPSSESGKEHDWLLCKLDDPVYRGCISPVRMAGFRINECCIDRRVVRAKAISERPTTNRKVIVVTSQSEPHHAQLLVTPSHFRPPGSEGFLEVLTIKSSVALIPGDCGAAIIDPVDGQWYGHLIAGSEDGITGYVLPASDIVADIARVINIPVSTIQIDDGMIPIKKKNKQQQLRTTNTEQPQTQTQTQTQSTQALLSASPRGEGYVPLPSVIEPLENTTRRIRPLEIKVGHGGQARQISPTRIREAGNAIIGNSEKSASHNAKVEADTTKKQLDQAFKRISMLENSLDQAQRNRDKADRSLLEEKRRTQRLEEELQHVRDQRRLELARNQAFTTAAAINMEEREQRRHQQTGQQEGLLRQAMSSRLRELEQQLEQVQRDPRRRLGELEREVEQLRQNPQRRAQELQREVQQLRQVVQEQSGPQPLQSTTIEVRRHNQIQPPIRPRARSQTQTQPQITQISPMEPPVRQQEGLQQPGAEARQREVIQELNQLRRDPRAREQQLELELAGLISQEARPLERAQPQRMMSVVQRRPEIRSDTLSRHPTAAFNELRSTGSMTAVATANAPFNQARYRTPGTVTPPEYVIAPPFGHDLSVHPRYQPPTTARSRVSVQAQESYRRLDSERNRDRNPYVVRDLDRDRIPERGNGRIR